MALPALKSSDLIFLGLYKRLLESIREHNFHCPKPPVMQSLLFQMHFIFSDEVVLLFDFWSVHSPAGFTVQHQIRSPEQLLQPLTSNEKSIPLT
ncbi:hypothetical protein J1605_019853 [Eschrichtius robustus]|uniref:Uncharacterized protein n=1 Tax=Eschrichtius robustus TaxID=9764 RepID=A0AB34HQ13_ESCRO|nr:hypothetical protein J1605_019853 [Eschrichtius robustus]